MIGSLVVIRLTPVRAISGSKPASGLRQSSVLVYCFASDDVKGEKGKKCTVFGPKYLEIAKHFCMFSLHF